MCQTLDHGPCLCRQDRSPKLLRATRFRQASMREAVVALQQGRTPLYAACRDDRLPLVELLLSKGADIEASTQVEMPC